MFMSCIGTFRSVVEGKKISMYIGSLLMSYKSIMDLTNENIKCYELISIYCVQWLIWSAKFPLLGLIMKYKKWRVCWIKNSESPPTQVQVVSSWTLMYCSWPITFITISKYIEYVYWGNPVYTMLSWTRQHCS